MDSRALITRCTGLAYRGLGQSNMDYYQKSAGAGQCRIAEAMEAGKVLKCIDDQRPIVRVWLLYAYSAVPEVDGMGEITTHLWGVGGDTRNPERLLAVLNEVAKEKALRVRGRTPRSRAAMAASVGIKRQHWARDWMRHEIAAMDELARLDNEGLEAVETMVAERR